MLGSVRRGAARGARWGFLLAAVPAFFVILIRAGGPWDQKLLGLICAPLFYGLPAGLLGMVLGAVLGVARR